MERKNAGKGDLVAGENERLLLLVRQRVGLWNGGLRLRVRDLQEFLALSEWTTILGLREMHKIISLRFDFIILKGIERINFNSKQAP